MPLPTVPKVRVVVVNYDGGEVTRRCVDALLATDHPADRLEIVVVDNASVDGLNWVLREQYPQVTLIESLTNEGFARGCNLAMRDLDGLDHLALINNDAIVQPGWLRSMLAPMDDPEVGAVSPKLLLNLWAHTVVLEPSVQTGIDDRAVGVSVDEVRINGLDRSTWVRFDERFWPEHPNELGRWTKQPIASCWWPSEDESTDEVELVLRSPVPQTVVVRTPGDAQEVAVGPEPVRVSLSVRQRVRVINSAGGGLYQGWFGGDRGFMEPDLGQYDEPAEIFAWCGGAVLLRAEYLRDTGIFDPTYFLYYEDFDLAWRGRSAGWKYRYTPSAVVFHEHAYSSKAGSDFFNFWVDRNRRLTLVKNAPAGVALRAAIGACVQAVRKVGVHVVLRAKNHRPPSPEAVAIAARPLTSFARALPSALRERRRLAKRRVVSHSAIEAWTIVK